MTSRIGNNKKGFTFIEVMVTLVVLSAGIVFVYKSFFLCADYLTRLSLRLDANQLLDNKISEIKRYVKDSRDLSFSRSGVLPIVGFNHRYQLDVQLTWEERGVKRHLSRVSMLEVG